jgi:hypothetical protein
MFACIVIDKLLRIHSMTERGLEEHELKAFGLFRQAKDPEWPPAPNNAERESEWPRQPRAKRDFYYLSGQSTSS